MYNKTLAIAVIVICFCQSEAYSFWLNTHERITDVSIDSANLNSVVKDQTGLDSPLEIPVSGKRLRNWIIFGSQEEDNTFGTPPLRYLNHFYEPLSGFGLTDSFSGMPSYEWAKSSTNDWSWRVARNQFLLGLTSHTDTARKIALANSFRALGQVMHLVQDLAVPAHVRNDAHPESDGFERYVDNNATPSGTTNFTNALISVSPSAPKQFWDSDKYDGKAPLKDASIGLAEYTNANFASADTLLTEHRSIDDKHYYPYPRQEETTLYLQDMPYHFGNAPVFRGYLGKTDTKGGEKIQHFAVTGRLYRAAQIAVEPVYIENPVPYLGFDDNCHNDYAQKLIPRAVGYSAGLLNYFFRGKVNMEKDPQNAGKYIIKNESGEKMEGTFALYYDDVAENRKAVSGANWTFSGDKTIGPGGKSDPVTFIEPIFPAPNEKGKYILVFQGKLGVEEGAVVGKVVSMEEGFFEDWEYGLTGRYPWKLRNSCLPFKDCSLLFNANVIDGYADNHSKVLQVNDGWYLMKLGMSNFQNSIDVPKKVSFDYYVNSIGADGDFSVNLKDIYGYGSCSIIMNNYGNNFCDEYAECWLPIETGKWTHVEVTDDMLKCSAWTSKIINIWISTTGNYDVSAELYLDNIKLSY